MGIYGKCPKCGTSWDAGEIPEKDRRYYSPPFRYSHIIAVEYYKDKAEHYRCHFCKTDFNFNGEEITKEGIWK